MFIQNMPADLADPFSGLVIGIDTTKKGNYLTAQTMAKKSPDWDNQLWDFVTVPLIENAFFLKHRKTGLVMDCHGGGTTEGTLLDAYMLKDPSPEYPNNQTWMFQRNPPGTGTFYFIFSIGKGTNMVVDLQPGGSIDIWPQKTKSPDWNNQQWGFVKEPEKGYLEFINPPKWKEPSSPTLPQPPGFND